MTQEEKNTDWDIKETEDGEGLKFSWKDEQSKKKMLQFIAEIGGLTKEDVDDVIKGATSGATSTPEAKSPPSEDSNKL